MVLYFSKRTNAPCDLQLLLCHTLDTPRHQHLNKEDSINLLALYEYGKAQDLIEVEHAALEPGFTLKLLSSRSSKPKKATHVDFGTTRTLQERFPEMSRAESPSGQQRFGNRFSKAFDNISEKYSKYLAAESSSRCLSLGLCTHLADLFRFRVKRDALYDVAQSVLEHVPVDVQIILGSPSWEFEDLTLINPTSTSDAGIHVDVLRTLSSAEEATGFSYEGGTGKFALRWHTCDRVLRLRRAPEKGLRCQVLARRGTIAHLRPLAVWTKDNVPRTIRSSE
ncbi:uncharacterized protein J3D65DRAFT_604731 [Phyllosticta citribraziliensis]|uniref:Uncharacterized protein n=1 Tax=Phyllosticta citribraziliensis TaxID=989973 RepID=A0ABR1LJI8_9PEZI